MDTPPGFSARRVGAWPGGACLIPPPAVDDRPGVLCGRRLLRRLFSAILFFMFFSRQQDNTFARITGPHRRYRGRVRFFSDPPMRWGGMRVSPG
jgi:hypothetical protein